MEEIINAIREKRGDRSYRDIEKEVGISASTLCRVENNKGDVCSKSLKKIYKWLDKELPETTTLKNGAIKKKQQERREFVKMAAIENQGQWNNNQTVIEKALSLWQELDKQLTELEEGEL